MDNSTINQFNQDPTSYRAALAQQHAQTLQAMQTQQQPQQPVQPLLTPLANASNALLQPPTAQASAQLQPTSQSSILSQAGPITENFGDLQSIEHYSNGITNGTGIGVPDGTGVALPPGQWKVLSSFNGATSGGQGDPQQGINSGYGNSVLAQNLQTGEKLRFSHLSKVAGYVAPGATLPGNTTLGLTGHTGNTTGPHLNLEYYNPQGQLGNVLQSSYAQYLPVSGGTSKGKGGGNPLTAMFGNLVKGYTESPDAYSQNPNAGLLETIGNSTANSPVGGLGELASVAGHAVAPALGHLGSVAPALSLLSTKLVGSDPGVLPVKTGLADAYANRAAMANTLKTFDTTLGDMAPANTPQLDLNLYPQLLSHWQTLYGANKTAPQSMGDLATQVRDGLRGALAMQRGN